MITKEELVMNIDKIYATINRLKEALDDCLKDCKDIVNIIEDELSEQEMIDIIDKPEDKTE